MVHISQQDQSLCRADLSNPGLLKRNLYDVGVTHIHYSQITQDEIESTHAHIHRASLDGPVFLGLLFCLHIVSALNVLLSLLIAISCLIILFPLVNNCLFNNENATYNVLAMSCKGLCWICYITSILFSKSLQSINRTESSSENVLILSIYYCIL